MDDDATLIKNLLEVVEPSGDDLFLFGTVTGTSGTKVLVRPETDSGTGDGIAYQRLTAYSPTNGDRVLMVRVGNTRVVIGKTA